MATTIRPGMKLAAAAAAIVAVAIGGFLVLRSGERTNGRGAAAAAKPVGSDAPALAAPAVAAKEPEPRLDAQRTDARSEEWNDGTHAVIGPIVEGTIVVIDREGERHAEEDGSFAPDFVDGVDADRPEGARRPRVAVKQGRFRFDARGATAMLAGEIELGGHAAVVDGGVDLSTGGPLALHARWLVDVLLHVVDATTKEELSGVRVCADAWRETSAEHPGVPRPRSILFDGERSPLLVTRESLLDRAVGDGTVWVGARDHAWKRERIDFELEREHRVELGRGGSLAITVTEPPNASPFDPRRGARVRLRHPERQAGEPICDVAAEPGLLGLEELVPGDVIAAIEIGDSHLTPLILSRAAVTIRAGETARATLSLDPAFAPKPTTLAGTAFVPPAWGDDRFMEVELFPADLRGGTRDDERGTRLVLESIAGRPGWHSWSVSPILPAKYRLLARRAGFETDVVVDEQGRDDVELVLPDPAVLHVRVVDAETQSDVPVDELFWTRADATDSAIDRLWRSADSQCCVGVVRPGRGRFVRPGRGDVLRTFHAVLGEIDPVIESDEEFTVRAGVNDIVLHAHAPCGVDLEIDGSGKEHVPLFVDCSRLVAGAPERAATQTLFTGGHLFVYVPEPGRYLLVGHRANETTELFRFEVDVGKGEIVKKQIRLDY